MYLLAVEYSSKRVDRRVFVNSIDRQISCGYAFVFYFTRMFRYTTTRTKNDRPTFSPSYFVLANRLSIDVHLSLYVPLFVVTINVRTKVHVFDKKVMTFVFYVQLFLSVECDREKDHVTNDNV
jgi:hypothetical protein